MKDQIAKAIENKNQARDARESNDLEEAFELITAATEQLDKLWKQRRESIDNAGANASPDERELVEALAETYGVKGGILRSKGQPEQAVHAYDTGLVFEQHSARKADNSYNLVQGLINRVLAAPHLVGAPDWEILGRNMWKDLENASSELRRQIATSRSRDPWAAADMIMVQLLLSPQDLGNGKQQVDEAWWKFEGLKPKPFVYESTLRTLKDLEKSLEQVATDRRLKGWDTVAGVLDTVVERFQEGFEKAKAR
jgi:hypothetical protein